MIFEIEIEQLSKANMATRTITVSRMGEKWTKEEDAELLKEVMEKQMTLQEIAQMHHRSIVGIKCRLMGYALDWIKKDGITMEEAAKRINISVEEIENFRESQKKKFNTPKKEYTMNDVMEVLLEIRDSLKKMSTVSIHNHY